jgi:hypothetical protein
VLEIDDLLMRAESETLDFKEAAYQLTDTRQRNTFLKDLLCLANEPRTSSAFIVLGVRWTPEAGSIVVGLDKALEDVPFHNALDGGNLTPKPTLHYHNYKHNGKWIGVIEIPVSSEGPYSSLKTLEDGPVAGVIYCRNGSRNTPATGNKLRAITEWFAGRSDTFTPSATESHIWSEFYDGAHRFRSDRTYILVTDRIPTEASDALIGLASVPWRAVLDFDPHSATNGLLSIIEPVLNKTRLIHRIVKGERVIEPEPGVHWFFAQGLVGRQESMVSSTDHRSWVREYQRELMIQLELIAKVVSPRPITVVVIWNSHSEYRKLNTLLELLQSMFQSLADTIVASLSGTDLQRVAEESGAKFIPLATRVLAAGLYAKLEQLAASHGSSNLPMRAGASYALSTSDALWMAENFEVLYQDLPLGAEESAEVFRRGGTVTWKDLDLHQDCDRDINAALRAQIEYDLNSRDAVRLNLYHAPGAGGTTVGRRIVWDVHTTFPSLLLNHYAPRQTAERLARISALTELSVLVLVDGSEHSQREIDELLRELQALQAPAVIFQVLRRFDRLNAGKRQFWLSESLNQREADRFTHVYSLAKPESTPALKKLAYGDERYRTAFFFGLTAYDRQYRGLSSYVSFRLNGTSAEQRAILEIIALAHYYGQQAIPTQYFAPAALMPPSQNVEFERFFDIAPGALELLVHEPASARASHFLVAQEMLQQLLAPEQNDDRAQIWKQALSRAAKRFLAFSSANLDIVSEDMLELVRRMFIYRDNEQVIGTERSASARFANLIEDIPSNAGRVEVLRELTTCFPEEAHFHAHFARFLAMTMHDFEDARREAGLATNLKENDPTIYHVQGMICRYEITSLIEERRDIDAIIPIARDGQVFFEKARSLRPDLEHGYISEIQMLIRVFDYAKHDREFANVISDHKDGAFFRQAVQRCEDLLRNVEDLNLDGEPSGFVLDCRAKLDSVYGDYSKALQTYNNLLDRSDVAHATIRRSIVYTLLRRRRGRWDDLNERELLRAVELLESNLEADSGESATLKLWLRAIRFLRLPPSLEAVIERVAYWRANTGELDAVFYLYVLNVLKAIEGSSQALVDASRAIEECKSIARFRADRVRSIEWVGMDDGIRRLCHQSRLGKWSNDFWENESALQLIEGTIVTVEGRQRGSIEIDGGVTAFFVPTRAEAGDRPVDFRDVNKRVSFVLGFTYDGPRAWRVRLV